MVRVVAAPDQSLYASGSERAGLRHTTYEEAAAVRPRRVDRNCVLDVTGTILEWHDGQTLQAVTIIPVAQGRVFAAPEDGAVPKDVGLRLVVNHEGEDSRRGSAIMSAPSLAAIGGLRLWLAPSIWTTPKSGFGSF
jgi:hypothetical protein